MTFELDHRKRPSLVAAEYKDQQLIKCGSPSNRCLDESGRDNAANLFQRLLSIHLVCNA